MELVSVRVRTAVQANRELSAGGGWIAAAHQDLSAGGLRAVVKGPLRVEAAVEPRIPYVGFSGKATLQHCCVALGGNGMGIQFNQILPPVDLDLLEL